MGEVDFSSGWEFEAPDGRWRRARVPGTIHGDLMAHGFLPDPDRGDHEKSVAWAERRSWRYRKIFDAPAAWRAQPRVELVFEGLDTIAELRLNGRLLGRAANMFRTHRFDVAGKFRPRGNVLEVRFASPTKWAKAREKRDGVFVQANGVDFRQHLRKAACHYGWDWGLRLATSGIWRRARLELGDGRGIGDWTLRTIGIGKGRATLEWTGRVRADAKGRGNWRWRIRARCGSHRWRSEARGAAFKKRLAVRAPRLWQPRGEGDANLYEVTLELLDGERLVDRKRFEFGVRTVRFDQTKDLHGVSFRCVVNGRPVWLRGANWVPVDSLIPRDEERRARELLDRAAEAGMNCVRVWGGGVYESDEFYSHCDRLGMLVWQDFAFACGLYPETPEYRTEVRAEAEDNIIRLRHHASLALWCGNNENDWAYAARWRGFRDHGKHLGARYYHRLLPALCRTLDPGRFYWPSSPWGGADPNGPSQGDSHCWEVNGKYDYFYYRDHGPRFVSEFGMQSLPTFETFTRALPPASRDPLGSGVASRQRHPAGMEGLRRQIESHYRLPPDLKAWTHVSQIHQAEAVRFAVEHWRSLRGVCSGALYWQLNDVWPAVSWSSIDSGLRPKALHFAAKRFFAPAIGVFVEEPRGLRALLLNDGPHAWMGRVTARLWTTSGPAGSAKTRTMRVGPGQVAAAFSWTRGECETLDARRSFLELSWKSAKGSGRSLRFFARAKDRAWENPEIKIRRVRDGVQVSAQTLAAGVWLHSRGRELPLEDNFFDLLPGETRLVKWRRGAKPPRGKIEAFSLYDTQSAKRIADRKEQIPEAG